MTAAPPASYLVYRRGPFREPVSQPEDFRRLRTNPRSGRGSFRLILPSVESGEPDEERALAEISAERIGDIRALRWWLRQANETMFMRGDCWHFALAVHRRYRLPMIGWINASGRVGHCAVDLGASPPTGPYLDIRGRLSGHCLAGYGRGKWRGELTPMALDRDAVLAAFEASCGEDGLPCDLTDRNAIDDPERYPFAGYAEWLADFLYQDILPRPVPVASDAMPAP